MNKKIKLPSRPSKATVKGNYIIEVLKFIVGAIAAWIFLSGWASSTSAWLYYLFTNWAILGSNGWMVATLFFWAVINIVWFIAAGMIFLFGFMDFATPKIFVLGVFAGVIIQAIIVFGLLIHFFGW